MQTPDLSLIDQKFNHSEMMLITSVVELCKIDTMKRIQYSDNYLQQSSAMFSKYVSIQCEYGTRPIKHTIPTDKRSFESFVHYNDVIDDIQKRNPENHQQNDPVRKWTVFGANISFLFQTQCRITFRFCYGDYATFRDIYTEFHCALNQHNLWYPRSEYLKLTEGADINAEEHPHIARYLFNDLVQREVCEFIGSGYYATGEKDYSSIGCATIILSKHSL